MSKPVAILLMVLASALWFGVGYETGRKVKATGKYFVLDLAPHVTGSKVVSTGDMHTLEDVYAWLHYEASSEDTYRIARFIDNHSVSGGQPPEKVLAHIRNSDKK